MWIGDTIYFNSDRDGTFNLYAYDVAKKTTTPLTTATTWDVRWPSADAKTGRIVYELNGELTVFDTKTGKSDADRHHACPTTGSQRRPSRVSVGGPDRGRRAQPEGRARAVRRARRHLHGADREGADAQPDALVGRARQVAALVARRREGRLHLRPVRRGGALRRGAGRASGKPEQLTKGGKAMRYAPAWSPDGTRIAFGDKDGKVYVVDVAARRMTADRRRAARPDPATTPGRRAGTTSRSA